MKKCIPAFLGVVAMLSLSAAAHCDSIISNGSNTVDVADTVQVTLSNCGGSSNICSENQTSGSFSSNFSITVPGITIPAGDTITGATLSFGFAPTSATGNFSTTSISEVLWGYQYYAGTESCGFLCYEPVYDDYYYNYYGPSYSVSGNLNGTFTSIYSPDGSSLLSPSSNGTVDLLALGFGSDLAARDSINLTGITNSNLNFGFFNTGFNANTTSNLNVNLSATPEATLEIDYTDPPVPTPEPGTLTLLSAGLLGLSVVQRRIFS